MSIKVKIPVMFQAATNGEKIVEISDCNNVGECLIALREKYPPMGKMLFDEGNNIAGFLMVFVNGQCVNHLGDKYHQPVKDGDEVYPIMMIEGG
jgi:molybdopterin converting factor small subunit